MRHVLHGQELMFGFLTASLEALDEKQLARYKACYCGLCRSLGERHGQLSRLTLNYDMTFLVLLLGSLYEPEERAGEDTCPVHPFEKRRWWRNEMSDYAADMNVALSYLKCRDNWHDDGSLTALAASGTLKRAYDGVCDAYPRQCSAMESAIAELSEIEKANADAPDAASATFGRLMGEILVYREDRWSDTLRRMGNALGQFIYVADACVDLDSDTFRGRYNPFRRYYGLDNERRFRDILKLLLGECVRSFDILPLVQDADILKNILCSGLWTGFDKKYNRKGPSDVSGSV